MQKGKREERKPREWHAIERFDTGHKCVLAYDKRCGAQHYKRVCKSIPWAKTSAIFKVREILPSDNKKKGLK